MIIYCSSLLKREDLRDDKGVTLIRLVVWKMGFFLSAMGYFPWKAYSLTSTTLMMFGSLLQPFTTWCNFNHHKVGDGTIYPSIEWVSNFNPNFTPPPPPPPPTPHPHTPTPNPHTPPPPPPIVSRPLQKNPKTYLRYKSFLSRKGAKMSNFSPL